MSPQSESPKSPDSASESSEGPATPSQATSPATPQATQLVSTGRHFDRPVATVNLPLTRASSVLFETLALAEAEGTAAMAGEVHRTTYATSGTPTTMALMDALAEIEGAPHRCRAAIMPSGLAAISVALLAYCKPGDHVLMSDSVYGPARTFATTLLERYGVVTEFFDPHIGAGIDALITPQTRVVYLESPGSYTFEIQDSPVMARPFDWGVDVSLLPLTKSWGGHADLLMGAAIVREEHWLPLWQAVRQLGICVGGDDAFLVLRGLRTAQVRMRQHEATALTVARWLQGRPEVASVLHPALPSHPQHALFKRDFLGSSGLFSFELKAATPAQLAALCERRHHFKIGYSWGGFESLIMPAKISALRTVRPWTGGPLVRLHCGLEDAQDLINDLEQGLAAMAAAG